MTGNWAVVYKRLSEIITIIKVYKNVPLEWVDFSSLELVEFLAYKYLIGRK